MNRGDAPSWLLRRLVIFGVLALCFYVVIRITEKDASRPVDEILVLSAFSTIIAVVGSYIFGASWENIKISGNMLGRRRPVYDEAESDPDAAGNRYRFGRD